MSVIPQHKKLIFFDGVCNLCNSSIQYIIKRDKKDVFMFAPLQSEAAKNMPELQEADILKSDSIVLYEPRKGVSIKSTAVLKIGKHLGFPSNVLVIFRIVPRFIRDAVYDYIAKNRYKWYGKRAQCMVPTAEIKAKFLE